MLPGKSIATESAIAEKTITPSPIQPESQARTGRRRNLGISRAPMPPAPSSQIRVVVAKYAMSCWEDEKATLWTKDASDTTARIHKETVSIRTRRFTVTATPASRMTGMIR